MPLKYFIPEDNSRTGFAYSEDDLTYLRTFGPKVHPITLCVTLKRNEKGVRQKLLEMEIRPFDYGATAEEAGRILGVSAANVRQAVRDGRLKTISEMRVVEGIQRGQYRFSIDDIRDLALKYPAVERSCMVCQKAVRGDIYCPKDLPANMIPKEPLPEKEVIFIHDTAQAKKLLGQTLKKIRNMRGMKQEEVKEAYGTSTVDPIMEFENGRMKVVSLDIIEKCFKAVGYNVKIQIERFR